MTVLYILLENHKSEAYQNSKSLTNFFLSGYIFVCVYDMNTIKYS